MEITGNSAGPMQRIQDLEAENRGLRGEIQRLKEENRRWMRMAGTDALTGLPNKISYMRALVPQAIQRASKERRPIGFVLFSADNIGAVNETHGREAGDQIVRGLGRLIRSILGESDRPGHIDGVHFAVTVYPGERDVVRGRANMLRARVRAHGFPCADTTVQITISAGVASLTPPEETDGRALGEEVFRVLSRAHYLAKKAGGNRVEVAPDVSPKGSGGKGLSL